MRVVAALNPGRGPYTSFRPAAMDQEIFRKYKDLIYRSSGIFLGENKEALVSARIGKRIRALALDGYEAYYDYVVADKSGGELSELLNAISTNVTQFFREPQHFEFLTKTAKQAGNERRKGFRVWCAASSTGEEPYSIAITIRETLAETMPVEIIASDISTKVLQIAKFGAYRAQDVQGIRPEVVKKYFQIGTGKAKSYYRVKSNVRELVAFKQINLSTPPFPIQGNLDLIFCRNVMIYFNDQLRGQLLKNFHALLRPGGFLILGLAESVSGKTAFFSSVEPSVYARA